MEPFSLPNTEEEDETTFDEYYQSLPKNTSLVQELVLHQGFWCWSEYLRPTFSFQTHYQAHPTDIFVCCMPKSGNTWLKSLLFATVDRHRHPISESPLLSHIVHVFVPNYGMGLIKPPDPMDKGSQPRLASTHLPFEALPKSIQESECKILYIWRNPLDNFVSLWFFRKGIVESKFPGSKFPSLEEFFEVYLQGISPYGPFFEHVLGYWKMIAQMPGKILFLKYEELLENPSTELKRIAEFIGHPFSLEEEQNGVVEEIVKLCSFNNLKETKVNKEGRNRLNFDNNLFYRKGKAGDWKNHLTPAMAERMHELLQQKFKGTGLPVEI